MTLFRLFTGLACLALLACNAPPPLMPGPVPGQTPVTVPAGSQLAPELVRNSSDTPPRAEAGACWHAETTPAVIETVTEQVQVTPERLAGDGSIATPALYQTRTQQRILAERQAVWFRVPCPDRLDPVFLASLQRALKVRGLYRGAITGSIDPATQRAIRRYQAPQGLDSGTLSLAAARQLGLVAFDRAALE